MDTNEYLIRRKSDDWKFSSIVSSDAFMHVNRIHPIKQRLVEEIVGVAKEEDAVKRIIIFGSSIRYDCDIFSDLDICIDWNEPCYDDNGVLLPFTRNMRKSISAITGGMADVVNYAYLDETDVKTAVENGVVVYEHYV